MLYNPHRNYDKGMDDAYMGIEPQNINSQQYMEGYEWAEELLTPNEQKDERSVAREAE